MTNHVANRLQMLDLLRRELVGPDPAGDELTTVSFEKKEDAYRPFRMKGSGEEILQRDRPTKRYGVGVLYPLESLAGEAADLNTPDGVRDEDQPAAEKAITEGARKELDRREDQLAKAKDIADADDFDLSLANAYRPSSMGVTFLAELPKGSALRVELSGARYEQFEVTIAGSKRNWWRRIPVHGVAMFDGDSVARGGGRITPSPPEINGLIADLALKVEVRARPFDPGNGVPKSLVTVCLVNRSRSKGPPDGLSLFQAKFTAKVVNVSGEPESRLLPYPTRLGAAPDVEDRQVALLYRDRLTFAVGHGCAANWSEPKADRVTEVVGDVLPAVEVPSMTNDVKGSDGTLLEARMDELAGLVPGSDGSNVLSQLIDGYSKWIDGIEKEAAGLLAEYSESATSNVKACRRVVDRMREGFTLLKQDALAAEAFRLANRAMLLQQMRHLTRNPRRITWDKKARRWSFSEPYDTPDLAAIPKDKGRWRPFQVAFLLMGISSAARHNHDDRDVVELIWFPTGGGKTEAYLGLAAFCMFLRRLRAIKAKVPDENAGTQVMMRYTLRLLTAQQFQRAAALLCAMENLRREGIAELGTSPFSIGIWVGGTPNQRDQARAAFRRIEKGDEPDHDIIVLDKCPWCRAQLGAVHRPGGGPTDYQLHGYAIRARETGAETVVAHCSDNDCPFHDLLPVEFVDEDIYDRGLPAVSLLIGTVDKFAMLAWRPAARRLFGFSATGERSVSPPELILQDELHLISGPLGSMVGLFETVIDELCTDRRKTTIRPKIVTSTATIRGYRDQVRAVFGRSEVELFPPPGLSAGDSYFASYARDAEGKLRSGRLYVGVNSPGLGSAQTAQVRVFTSLLQGPYAVPETERDPWWTLLMFYNSLRELGGALTLFQSDIPEYVDAVRRRTGRDWAGMRPLRHVRELTGRLDNSEVREALSALEVATPGADPAPVDACLASNIIEVGVDVDRLSLLTVVGQPKTTAQYIQVTGRVGRRWWERPGLIVTLYSASKPRDRSHFEKFRTYHERLYAQVEPTSVTPFSRPAVQRALHAAMITAVRQGAPDTLEPDPCPVDLLKKVRLLVEKRVEFVDPEEKAMVLALFDRRIDEWQRWKPLYWARSSDSGENVPLLRFPGEHATAVVRLRSWETPTSMRNVDAECDVRVSTLYS